MLSAVLDEQELLEGQAAQRAAEYVPIYRDGIDERETEPVSLFQVDQNPADDEAHQTQPTQESRDLEAPLSTFNSRYGICKFPTREQAEADAMIAAREESRGTVEKCFLRAETPTTIFDKAFGTPDESRSRHSLRWVEFQCDRFLAAKKALCNRESMKLWFLFRMLYVDGNARTIDTAKLAASREVQEIKIRVGTELRNRGLHQPGLYFQVRSDFIKWNRKGRS